LNFLEAAARRFAWSRMWRVRWWNFAILARVTELTASSPRPGTANYCLGGRRAQSLALTFEVPAGTYANQPEPVISKGLAYGYFARADSLTEQMAYDLARATFGSGDQMVAIYPGGNPRDFVELTLSSTIPLHAGVARYFEEQASTCRKR